MRSPGAEGVVALTVNGTVHRLAVPRSAPLLTVLRNDLGLNGPKYGCGLGQCGACMVLVDGVAARSCVVPVGGVAGRSVTTLEGLGDGERLHPVQQAFIDCQAAQCGYCLNGMIVTTVALLDRSPAPTEAQIREALSHNLCRCGTHLEILAAVRCARDRKASVASEAPARTAAEPGCAALLAPMSAAKAALASESESGAATPPAIEPARGPGPTPARMPIRRSPT